jgi:hypothetical protein
MNPPITITEVIGRSEQGMTRPFLCHADDWATYYVKGAFAGLNSLCCEWVASRLAKPLVDKDQPRREMLWVYDFNLAFDEDFNRDRIFGSHVFGGMLKKWPEGFREKMEPRMRQALGQVRAIFSELPVEWLHLDGDESLPVQLDEERVTSALELPFTNPELFWKLP